MEILLPKEEGRGQLLLFTESGLQCIYHEVVDGHELRKINYKLLFY